MTELRSSNVLYSNACMYDIHLEAAMSLIYNGSLGGITFLGEILKCINMLNTPRLLQLKIDFPADALSRLCN